MAKPEKPYRHRTIGNHALHPETLMMSYGYDPKLSEGALKCPIFQTSTFVFRRAEEGKAFFEIAYGLREKRPGRGAGAHLLPPQQSRPGDPRGPARRSGTSAEACAVFESGMAAIATDAPGVPAPGRRDAAQRAALRRHRRS